MAADINSVTIVGRLTRDADLKYTNSGFAISNLGVAVNRARKDGDQWIEEANFFDVTLLGRRAEALNQYLQKGLQVAVTGELRQERWEQDGQKRSRVTIQANNIKLLGGGKPIIEPPVNNNQQTYENYPSGMQGGSGNFEDDIPF